MEGLKTLKACGEILISHPKWCCTLQLSDKLSETPLYRNTRTQYSCLHYIYDLFFGGGGIVGRYGWLHASSRLNYIYDLFFFGSVHHCGALKMAVDLVFLTIY